MFRFLFAVCVIGLLSCAAYAIAAAPCPGNVCPVPVAVIAPALVIAPAPAAAPAVRQPVRSIAKGVVTRKPVRSAVKRIASRRPVRGIVQAVRARRPAGRVAGIVRAPLRLIVRCRN